MAPVRQPATQPGLRAVQPPESLLVTSIICITIEFFLKFWFEITGVGTGGAAVPAAVIACNGLQGVCMVSCAASFLAAPTP